MAPPVCAIPPHYENNKLSVLERAARVFGVMCHVVSRPPFPRAAPPSALMLSSCIFGFRIFLVILGTVTPGERLRYLGEGLERRSHDERGPTRGVRRAHH